MKSIPLTQGKFAIVDDEDYDFLMKHKWSARLSDTTWYACTRIKNKQVQMHRFILGVTDPSMQVDHKDRNGLHNWRGNLRKCTHAQNLRNRGIFRNNTTGYKGVSLFRQGRYQAKIRINGKLKHLGLFSSLIEAARAYDAAARKAYGEFASLNFPD